MRLFQTISMAFRAIAANKIRSFLTMLGVIIGVMSVIVLVSIGQGTTASITDSISSMGTNLLTVTIQTRRIGMGGRNFRSNASSRGTVILKLPEILELEEEASIPCVPGLLRQSDGQGRQYQHQCVRDGRSAGIREHHQSGC